jgi:hypothetical protein
VSNELSNYCDADRQPPLDDPGSFGAPGIWIDARLACFTPKRSVAAESPLKSENEYSWLPDVSGVHGSVVREGTRYRSARTGI